MDKKTVAAILDEIGTLLELQGENSFRCNAYHSAARAIDQLEEDLALLIAEKRLDSVRGIGSTLQDKITTLVATGELEFYTELKAKIPAGLVEMLRLPGMGPKKIRVLADQLGVTDLLLLKAACEAGTVAALKGFGAKTQQKILEGLAFVEKVGQRVRIDEAMAIAEALLAGVRDAPGVLQIELCGSLRRRKETIQDIDLLVASKDAGPIMDRFVALPGVVQVVGRGDTKASVMVERQSGGVQTYMNADLRVVLPEQFPFALHYFTGSKEHNVAIRGLAQKQELKLNEYELVGPKKSVACKDEAELFKALGLDYIAPELRENTGEVEAAASHQLPVLIEKEDLRGTFHCHALVLYVGQLEFRRIDVTTAHAFRFQRYPAIRTLLAIFLQSIFPTLPTFEIGHGRDGFLQTIEKMKNRLTAIRQFHPTVQVGVQAKIVAQGAIRIHCGFLGD